MAITLQDFAAQTQVPMMKGLVQVVTNNSVIMGLLRFIPVDGFAYRYNRQQTLGGIAFRGLNQNYSDAIMIAKGARDVGIVNPELETLAIFGGDVQTDRQLIDKQGDAVRASRIAGKLKRAALFFDKNFIVGDPAKDPNAFLGIAPRLVNKQLIWSGDGKSDDDGTGTKAHGPIVLDNLVKLQDAVVGADNENKPLFMNKNARRALSSKVRSEARGMGVFDASGTQIQSFNGSPVKTLDEDGDDQPVLTNTETNGGSATTNSIYCVRFGGEIDEENVQGLVGSKMIEHVAVGLLGTFFIDLIESLMGIGVFHPRAAARLIANDAV